MGGSWEKGQELEVESGGMHYEKADVNEASVQIIDNTAIFPNSLTLLAVVGSNEDPNRFIVTEVPVKQNREWKSGLPIVHKDNDTARTIATEKLR